MKAIRLDTRQVRATLDGTMTEIRVPMKPQPDTRHCRLDFENGVLKESSLVGGCWTVNRKMNPPYQPGDILYVRETCYFETFEHYPLGTGTWVYKADNPEYPATTGWIPSVRMPKEAARLFLKVAEVRAERVQDITEEGAIAEGCAKLLMDTRSARNNFMNLWNQLNFNRGLIWAANSWVWVIKFEKAEADYGEKLQSV